MQEGDQAGNGSHRSGQQGRQDRGIEPSDPVPALQPGQVQEACSQALKMSAAGESSRSIAVELALLFLRELVPTVAEDPERLVSTEAVLSFAAVRRGDPVTWQRWRRILEKYEKADLIEHMLGAPVPMDSGDGESAADRLISGLCSTLESNSFTIPTSTAGPPFASTATARIVPFAPARSSCSCLRTYYQETGKSPGAQAVRATLDLLEAKALFDGGESPINLRVANHRGKLYLDLCDRAWRAVEIDAEGWRIVDRPPPRFHRTRGSPPTALTRARRQSRRTAPLPERRPPGLDSYQGLSGCGAASQRAVPDPCRQG